MTVARASKTALKRRRSLLQRAALLVAGLIGVIVVFVVVMLLVNLPDRTASPAAIAWLQQANAQLAPDAKGDSLWALDAPAGDDAAALGHVTRAAYLARDERAVARSDWAITRPYQGQPLVLPVELGCIDPASACVASALAHSQTVRSLAAQRAALLLRLDALDSGGVIIEATPPAQPNAPAAQYTTLVAAHSLSLALAEVDIGDANLAAGTARLERMTRVARNLLAGCASLVCKETGSGMLRRSLLVYSELMSQTSATAALSASLHKVDAPLSGAELNVVPVLNFELQIAHSLDAALVTAPVQSSDPLEERLALYAAPWVFKPDATFNLQAELADLEKGAGNVSPFEFSQSQKKTFETFAHRADQIGRTSLASIYNPLGRVLASGLPSIEDVAAQVRDDDVLIAAVKAKSLLLSKHAHVSEAQAVLFGAAPGIEDPYTRAPFTYSKASSSIVLTQHGSRPVTALRTGLEP